jgi:catechol 2,3-dioxygenase-like lactoylglutathione lyase family enzyme
VRGAPFRLCCPRFVSPLVHPEPAMPQSLTMVALVVADYDAAIAWYTRVLGFTLVEDTGMGDGKRWVVIAPPGEAGTPGARLLLARAANDEQASRVGNQTGGRVFLFLRTDDFARDYSGLKARGVEFVEEPRHEAYGTVVVFRDLYGNRWDLVGPPAARA